jgi:hypothetical protein
MRDGLRLVCVECGREQIGGERGWRALLTDEQEPPVEAVVYCPACAVREFGPSKGGSSRD